MKSVDLVKSKLKIVTDDLANNPRYDKMRIVFDSKPFKIVEKTGKVVMWGVVGVGIVLGCIL